jgi:hypothetical protein
MVVLAAWLSVGAVGMMQSSGQLRILALSLALPQSNLPDLKRRAIWQPVRYASGLGVILTAASRYSTNH